MNRDLMRAAWHRHREPLVIPSLVQLPSAEDSHEQFHEGVRTHEEDQAHVEAESPEPAATRR